MGALGGVLCESIYAYLATESVVIFDAYPKVKFWMQWAIIALLSIVGTITFFQKTAKIQHQNISMNGRLFLFLKGISLSLFNPALVPFWVVVLLSYQKYDFLKISTSTEKTIFVLGAGTGTFLLVYTYAFIAHRKKDLVFKYLTDSRLNKIVGGIFIGLAAWQLLSMA